MLKRIGGREVPCYLETVDGESMSEKELSQLASKDKNSVPQAQELPARCHCGTIDLKIARPELKDAERYAWLFANNTKYMGKFCVCRACRLGCGFPMQSWTYVPPQRILRSDGEAVDFGVRDTNVQGFSIYNSSERVRWYFCGTCGATVLYRRDDRPDFINVGVGVLRAETGALAKEWVEWSGELFPLVMNRGSGLDGELIEAVAAHG